MRELVQLAAEGKVKTHVSRVASLSQINQVLVELEKGKYPAADFRHYTHFQSEIINPWPYL